MGTHRVGDALISLRHCTAGVKSLDESIMKIILFITPQIWEPVMQPDLLVFIEEVKQNKERILGFDEAKIKQSIILQIFYLLGWDVFRDLIAEYAVGDGRVDYAVQLENTNYIFIEAKRYGTDLENVQAQLLRYAFSEGVKLGVLTNGIAWWLYLPLADGGWEQRRYYAIDLLEQDSGNAAEHLVKFLSREQVVSGHAVASAEQYRQSQKRLTTIQQTFPVAWNKLVSEPHELLLELLVETTETLSGYRAEPEAAASFLLQYRSELCFPEPRDRPRLPVGTVSKTQSQPNKSLETASVTGTKPLAFSVGQVSRNVSSWKDLLIEVCNILYDEDPQRFIDASLSLKGRKRPYFTRNPDEMRSPEEFGNTGVYFEANQSASSILLRCQTLLAMFDYDPNILSVTLDTQR